MQSPEAVPVPFWGKTHQSHSCGNKLKSEAWEKPAPGTVTSQGKASFTDFSVLASQRGVASITADLSSSRDGLK